MKWRTVRFASIIIALLVCLFFLSNTIQAANVQTTNTFSILFLSGTALNLQQPDTATISLTRTQYVSGMTVEVTIHTKADYWYPKVVVLP